MKTTTSRQARARNYRHRRPFFPAKENGQKKQTDPDARAFFGSPVQTKLTVGKADDPYEKEADAVADRVVNRRAPAGPDTVQRMGEKEEEQAQTKPDLQLMEEEEESAQMKPDDIQRMGQEEEEQAQTKPDLQLMEEEEESAQTKPDIQRAGQEEEEAQTKPTTDTPPTAAPGRGETLAGALKQQRGQGSPLPDPVRGEMEHGLGADFANVRLHTDTKAEDMSRELSAQAFANKNDIYFAKGKYNPSTKPGRHLLAHELTHVVQQRGK